MNKNQIEKLLEIYKQIQEKETEISKFLKVMNRHNYNNFDLLTDLFHQILDNIIDNVLDDEISYFIYDCEFWKKPREIKNINWKIYKINSIDTFIDYLIKEKIITE